MLQILAGTDTTSTALRVAMLYLMTNAGVYAKLRAEIDQHVSPDDDHIIPDSIARDLVYLKAVLRESMRMHPPVADLFTRRVPEGGDTFSLDGEEVFLPGGTDISYSVGMQHSAKNFGPDAHVFRPERWLPENTPADQLARMVKINDMIFGYGKFHCLGYRIAFMEIQKTVAELVRRFDMGLMNPSQPWRSLNYLGLYTQTDMWVRVTKRAQ